MTSVPLDHAPPASQDELTGERSAHVPSAKKGPLGRISFSGFKFRIDDITPGLASLGGFGCGSASQQTLDRVQAFENHT